METIVIDNPTEEDIKKFDEFNLSCDIGNVFQSFSLNKSLDLSLIFVKDNDEIVGASLFFMPLKGLFSFMSELRIVSGPVLKDVNDKKVFEAIIGTIVNEAKKRNCIRIALRMPFAGLKEVLVDKGFEIYDTVSPDHSFNVNLNMDKEVLWQNLNKKTRNQIRKAKKEGVVVREARGDEIEKVYSLYLDRAKDNKGQVPYPLNYFQSLKNNLKENAKFMVAEYQGKLIAESVFLFFKNKIYYFNNGSLPEYWNLNANQLLVWQIMENYADSNNILNLYGVPDGKDENAQAYSLYKFKSGFGGELVREFLYAGKTISPFRRFIFNKILIKLLPLYKKLK